MHRAIKCGSEAKRSLVYSVGTSFLNLGTVQVPGQYLQRNSISLDLRETPQAGPFALSVMGMWSQLRREYAYEYNCKENVE